MIICNPGKKKEEENEVGDGTNPQGTPSLPSLPRGWHKAYNPVYIFRTPGELLEGSAMWKSTNLTVVLLETFQPP